MFAGLFEIIVGAYAGYALFELLAWLVRAD